jgi:hypothetical protein
VVFEATGQLLIVYSAFFKCLRKSGIHLKQGISIYRLQETCYSVRREVLYGILIEFGIHMELVDVPACCVMPPLETPPPPPRRSEWGSNLPPDCFVSRGSISHMCLVTKVFYGE